MGCPVPEYHDNQKRSTPRCRTIRSLAYRSCCPSGTWLQVIAPLLAAPEMLYVNVGANKGYNVNIFLSMFEAGYNVSNTQWHQALLQQRPQHTKPQACFDKHHPSKGIPRLCGACCVCFDAPPRRVSDSRVSVLAVEMMPATAMLLQHNFGRFRVTGTVAQVAISNSIGAKEVHMAIAGEEDLGIGGLPSYRQHEPAPPKRWVNLLTLDALMRSKGLAHRTIQLLSIDVEGFDALVLRGANATLRRTLVVEFEYHKVGVWKHMGFWPTIDWLAQQHNFRCYWQGDDDSLAPVLAECDAGMKDAFWGNVVCTRSDRLARMLETLVKF